MKRTHWIWPLLWAAAIFASSSGVITTTQLSHAVANATGGQITETAFRHFWHSAWWFFVKGWHALEFGILFLLIRRAFPERSPWPMIIAVAYAVGDEAHQLLVPDRGGRLSDVCIDALGITAAWIFTTWFKRRKTNNPFLSAKVIAVLIPLLLAAVFLLSIYPFGQITLNHAPNPAAP